MLRLRLRPAWQAAVNTEPARIWHRWAGAVLRSELTQQQLRQRTLELDPGLDSRLALPFGIGSLRIIVLSADQAR